MCEITPEIAKNLNLYRDLGLHGLLLNEMRFMIYVVSKIREQSLNREDLDQLLAFDLAGFKEVYGVSGSDSRRISARIVKGFGALEGQPYTWIEYIESRRETIYLTLTERVRDLVCDVKKPIFNFPIFEITELHSNIALRFFDYIHSNNLIDKEFDLSVDQMREIFLAFSEAYDSPSNVRSKLVNLSINLINEHTSLFIVVTRRSKCTTGNFKFHCSRKSGVFFG